MDLGPCHKKVTSDVISWALCWGLFPPSSLTCKVPFALWITSTRLRITGCLSRYELNIFHFGFVRIKKIGLKRSSPTIYFSFQICGRCITWLFLHPAECWTASSCAYCGFLNMVLLNMIWWSRNQLIKIGVQEESSFPASSHSNTLLPLTKSRRWRWICLCAGIAECFGAICHFGSGSHVTLHTLKDQISYLF